MTTATGASAGGVAILQRLRRARGTWLLLLAGILLLSCVASVAIGSREVALVDVWNALSGSADSFDAAVVAKRVPRTLLAAAAGAALAVSGLAMQGITRNPLADPGILGVNTGAALAVVTGIAWFGLGTLTEYIWTAMAGAGLAATFVWLVGSSGRGGATPLKLTLAGAATAAALTSVVTAVVLPRPQIADSVTSWQIGGVGGATAQSLAQVTPFLAVGLLICAGSARGLNLLGLGEELATGLGTRVRRTRLLAAIGAVMLCGATTALTGPIAFVGLVVPHFARLLIGTDHRWLLPFCAIGGAILLIASDVIGRVIAPPVEVDVGIITALLGAPIFIGAVRARRVREL